MFGADFAKQFGLPGPPWENLDAYGGMFGATGTVTPLPGSDLVGEQKAGPVATTAQAPVAGTPGVAPPQGPPIISGDFSPETFYAQNQGDQEGGGMSPSAALSPGALAMPTGLTSEFAKAK